MRNILVTGGAGFIGSHFIDLMLSNHKEIKVFNIDKLTYAGDKRNNIYAEVLTKYQFIKGDITDKPLINDIINDYHIDTIINFAAESHVDRSIENSEVFVKTNILGVQNLLEASRKSWGTTNNKRFIQISTDEVYGEGSPEDRFCEKSKLNPRNPYSASKAAADHLVMSYYATYGLPVIILRSSNNYGSRQHVEKLIPKVINNIKKNMTIPIYGDGKQERDWIYVMDNCRAIEKVLLQGDIGEIYNICSNKYYKNIDTIKKIINVFTKITGQQFNDNKLDFVTDRPGHDRGYYMRSEKIKELGWKPLCIFEDGLQDTIKYYLELSQDY